MTDPEQGGELAGVLAAWREELTFADCDGWFLTTCSKIEVACAALERQAELEAALGELLGALDEYIDYDDEYHKVGPFVHRVKALLVRPAEEEEEEEER